MTLPDNWNELTPDERLQFRLDAWQNMPVEFASPEVAQAYRDRVQLYRDVLELKKPATVPIAPWIGLCRSATTGTPPSRRTTTTRSSRTTGTGSTRRPGPTASA